MSNNITNPLSANQIANVEIQWKCLTEPTCNTLPLSLQVIVDAICELQNFDASCLGTTSFPSTMQALINKACEVPETISVPELSYNINNCTPDSWDCSQAQPCLNLNTTDPEEIIQVLTNAIISTRNVVKDLCEDILILQSQVNTLQLQLSNGCC